MEMHAAAEAASWVALVAGLATAATGIITLARRRVVLPWMRRRVHWKPWGRALVLMGVFGMLEVVPRLAGASADLVLGLSIAAVAPLAGAVALQARAHLPKS